MRRFQASLIAAGLATALSSAAAGPSPDSRHGHPVSPPATETSPWTTSNVRLGAMVIDLTPELRTHFGAAPDRGVLIARVEPGTPAARAGLAAGDVLTEVQGRPVADPADVRAALATRERGGPVRLQIVRDRQPRALDATVTGDGAATSRFLGDLPGWIGDAMRSFLDGDGGARAHDRAAGPSFPRAGWWSAPAPCDRPRGEQDHDPT